MYTTEALIPENKNDFVVICPKCGQEYHLNSINDMTVAECEVCNTRFIVKRPCGFADIKNEVKFTKCSNALDKTASSANPGMRKQVRHDKNSEVQNQLNEMKKDMALVASICCPIAILMTIGSVVLLLRYAGIAISTGGVALSLLLLFSFLYFFQLFLLLLIFQMNRNQQRLIRMF